MPAIPIIDSHVHLWDPNRFRMPWLDKLPAINKSMDLTDYAAATNGIDVEGLVYLQVEVAPQGVDRQGRGSVGAARIRGRRRVLPGGVGRARRRDQRCTPDRAGRTGP